jgi:hypothetical protein
MKRAAACLVFLSVMAAAIPAEAHGTASIRRHRFTIVDGSAKVRGTYVTSRPHPRMHVTAFIIQGVRVIGEKNRGCSSCRRVRVQLRVACHVGRPVYAVVQGDVHGNGHFAVWNSKTLVCEAHPENGG